MISPVEFSAIPLSLDLQIFPYANQQHLFLLCPGPVRMKNGFIQPSLLPTSISESLIKVIQCIESQLFPTTRQSLLGCFVWCGVFKEKHRFLNLFCIWRPHISETFLGPYKRLPTPSGFFFFSTPSCQSFYKTKIT